MIFVPFCRSISFCTGHIKSKFFRGGFFRIQFTYYFSLIQPQYHPLAVEEQVAVIYCGTKGLLENVPVDKVAEFEKLFLQLLHARHQSDVLDLISQGQMTDDIAAKLNVAAQEIAARYN